MIDSVDRQELTAVRLEALRALSTGGEAWAVTRRTGASFSSPPVGTSAGTAAGLLHRKRPEGVTVAAPGTPAPAVTWQFTRTGGVAIQTGDELQDASGVRVSIGPRTAIVLTETWEATRL